MWPQAGRIGAQKRSLRYLTETTAEIWQAGLRVPRHAWQQWQGSQSQALMGQYLGPQRLPVLHTACMSEPVASPAAALRAGMSSRCGCSRVESVLAKAIALITYCQQVLRCACHTVHARRSGSSPKQRSKQWPQLGCLSACRTSSAWFIRRSSLATTTGSSSDGSAAIALNAERVPYNWNAASPRRSTQEKQNPRHPDHGDQQQRCEPATA